MDEWAKRRRGERENDPNIDLLAPLPHTAEYTYLREVLLIADHNAYHTGQLMVLRRALGIWQSK